jgi:DNA primase
LGGRISESTIREVRDRADIVEVVSETVPLSRAGASFRGLCPFHREKTPSFFVHPARQAFKCFGCGEGGSVFHFLMKARNLSFADSVEELAERYGVAVRYEGGTVRSRPQEDLYALLRLAADTYRDLLDSPAGKGGREFLRRRGVTPEAQREFALGWCGTGGELLSALKREGIDPARGEAAGLLLPSGNGYRDRFRGRVLFPIGDARGRICGFGGRAVDDAVPKYLNSPESELYRKSSLLYGLYQALPALRSEGRVLVVEGYMDLIGLWQKGIRGVVATCGTSLTESHARTLKRLSENVILFYDGDVAGKKAAVRSGGPLYAAGVSPKALFPPKGMDPDDWAKTASPEELTRRISGAVPLMESIERGASRKYDLATISGKLSYVKLMANYLRWVTDPAERELRVSRWTRSTARSGRPPCRSTRKGAPRRGGRNRASRRATSCGCLPSTLPSRSWRAGTGSRSSSPGRTPGKPSRTLRTWPSGPPGRRDTRSGRIFPTARENFCPPSSCSRTFLRRRRAGATRGRSFPSGSAGRGRRPRRCRGR